MNTLCRNVFIRENVFVWFICRSRFVTESAVTISINNSWGNRLPNPNSSSQTRWFSTKSNEATKEIVSYDDFHSIRNKTKETYLEMLYIYKDRERLRRGHVEFIYSALKYMKEFGVEKDLEIYKQLIDILPKGKMVPKNFIQAEFMHYPKQQQCAIDLLEQMELNGVIPDWNMEDQLINVFGRRGHPVRRYWRMMYWMPKFKNASPWAIPETVSNDPYQLALHAVERMMSVDISSVTTTYKTSDIEDSLEDTWIVSGQSPSQQELLADLPNNTPIFVEGRFRIYIRKLAVTYFILRADVKTPESPETNFDDVSNLYLPLFSKPRKDVVLKPSVHEQDDGIILAVCCTGTSSRDSLLSWIRSLEKDNPHLKNLSVVFTLKAPVDESSLTEINSDGQELNKLPQKQVQ